MEMKYRTTSAYRTGRIWAPPLPVLPVLPERTGGLGTVPMDAKELWTDKKTTNVMAVMIAMLKYNLKIL